MRLRRVHQLVGLSIAVLWLVQIATGVMLTFRQEIDNFLVGGGGAPLNVVFMGKRIESIQAGGGTVSSIWVYDFTATRFDVLYSDRAHHDRKMRVDGAGQILRDGPADSAIANGGFFATLTDIHTTLLAGGRGKWIMAVSGLLLVCNLIFGLNLAWPRPGQWRKTLVPRTTNLYALHRASGLYIAWPLLVLVSAGIALCFDDELQTALHVARDPPAGYEAASSATTNITPEHALSLALARFPGSTLTALSMPLQGRSWYSVQLRIPGEIPRMYGQTVVYLSARSGEVLQEYPAVASAATPTRLMLDWMYPIHTAEAGGIVARVILVCLGCMSLLMGYFGILMWYRRRTRSQRK